MDDHSTPSTGPAVAEEIAALRARLAQLEGSSTNGHAPRADRSAHERRYRSLADAMPQLVWATDAKGAHTYFNNRWYEYTGLSEQESLGFGFANALHPDDMERTLERWRRAWHDGDSYEIEYRFRRHDGVYQWFVGRAMPVRDETGAVAEWVGTCTNIDEQKRIATVQTFLSQASRILAESLDYEETLARVANLAVPHIADWCAVDICEPDGSLHRVAVAHIDPAKVALAHEIQRRVPYDPNAPTGVAAVLRSGRSELLEDIPESLVRQAISDRALLEIFLSLGLRSSMVVPLNARGRLLGAITLVAAESGRRFTPLDLELAEELGRRAAIAVEHAELYRELDQFKTTLDDTLDCVFMFDPETLRFFYVNQGATEQVGYSHNELLGMTPLDIKPLYSEASFRAMIAPLLAGTLPSHTFQTVHRHKDGHDVPVEVALQYVAPPGERGRFVAIVRDISERVRAERELRESERRYRALADAMPLIVWTNKADGTLNFLNQTWFAFTGSAPNEDPLASVHPDDHEIQRRWYQALERGDSYAMEYRVRRHDGEYRWHLARIVPVTHEGGGIDFWIGTATDIHDQKQAAEAIRLRAVELTRITKMLENRNRELDHFAYVTSHDLKAPLRGIANLSQWIEEDLGEHATPEIQQQMNLLRGRVHRMEALIDGILQYSRVGRVKNNVELVDVAALLHEVIDLQAAPSDFTITVGPNMPTFRTERVPLQQVFTNLLSNAIKHHDRPAGTVTIDVAEADGMYEFRVADDGPGIAPEYHERIFVIFQTLAPRDKIEGSGLGLSLVKKIVETHGGTITVESDGQRGTTFRFTWPMGQD